jgi:hypothetical protein
VTSAGVRPRRSGGAVEARPDADRADADRADADREATAERDAAVDRDATVDWDTAADERHATAVDRTPSSSNRRSTRSALAPNVRSW